jgi:hypothetical protein
MITGNCKWVHCSWPGDLLDRCCCCADALHLVFLHGPWHVFCLGLTGGALSHRQAPHTQRSGGPNCRAPDAKPHQ